MREIDHIMAVAGRPAAGPPSTVVGKSNVDTEDAKGIWTDLSNNYFLSKFAAELHGIVESAGHQEMYGVHLQPPAEG